MFGFKLAFCWNEYTLWKQGMNAPSCTYLVLVFECLKRIFLALLDYKTIWISSCASPPKKATTVLQTE